MFAPVFALIAGLLFLHFLITEERTVNCSGKTQTVRTLHGEWMMWPSFIGNIRKNKTCHGESNARRIKIAVQWLFVMAVFSFGSFLQLLPKLNVWQLNCGCVLWNLPLPINWKVSNKDVMEFSDKLVTAVFYLTILPLQMCLCNKLSHKLFPHSEKAKAVEHVVLAAPELPDFYKSITQINEKQVVVDYTGNPVDAQAFVAYKRKLSEGLGCQAEVQLGQKIGTVLVIFGSQYRVDLSQWRNNPDNDGITKAQVEKPKYLYAFLNGETLQNGERVIKQGICTDIEATLASYKRGIRNPKTHFVLQAGNGLTEASLFEWFAGQKLPRKKGDDRGEFFRENDEWYDRLDKLLLRYGENLKPELKKYLSPEVLERNADA